VSCEEDVNRCGPLACDACGVSFEEPETLCPVCDAPNPWTPRDSIHFWCRTCGTTQRYLSHRSALV